MPLVSDQSLCWVAAGLNGAFSVLVSTIEQSVANSHEPGLRTMEFDEKIAASRRKYGLTVGEVFAHLQLTMSLNLILNLSQ